MILNTGNRTDIPAYFSQWLINRINEGFVYSRNPYNPTQIYRYDLNPNVIDCIIFCTKNPIPMLKYLNLIEPFNQYWMVTITPYGKEIEPNVPNKNIIIKGFIELSKKIGKKHVAWRYDPIFLTEKYSIDYHIHIFEKMAQKLSPYTDVCIISFIDLYKKTRNNFPTAKEVPISIQHQLILKISEIALKYNIKIKTCAEKENFSAYNVDQSGCVNQETIEKSLNITLNIPRLPQARTGCNCILGADIGQYNTCMHHCKYCYANYDTLTVQKQFLNHNPFSPLLIGDIKEGDQIIKVNQKSWINQQLSLF